MPVDLKGVASFTLRGPGVEQSCGGSLSGQTLVTRAASTQPTRPISISAVPAGRRGLDDAEGKLPSRIVALVRRNRLLRVRLAVDAIDAAGNATTTKAEVALRGAATKKKRKQSKYPSADDGRPLRAVGPARPTQ